MRSSFGFLRYRPGPRSCGGGDQDGVSENLQDSGTELMKRPEEIVGRPWVSMSPARREAFLRKQRAFRAIKAGDKVTCLLTGDIATDDSVVFEKMKAHVWHVQLRVTHVDDELIWCGEPPEERSFDRDTGIEVNEEFGWGPKKGHSGSFLILEGDTT